MGPKFTLAGATPESNPDTLLSTNEQTSPLREASASDLLPTDDDDGLVISLSIIFKKFVAIVFRMSLKLFPFNKSNYC